MLKNLCYPKLLKNFSFFKLEAVYYVLLSYVPSAFSGGMIGSFTAIWSYISSTTPPKLRAARMTIAELVIFAGDINFIIEGSLGKSALTIWP